MAKQNYSDLTKSEVIQLLVARDRRDATRFGLVWEANEIERDKGKRTEQWRRHSQVGEECSLAG